MATVTEQFQSRTGGGRGVDGIEPPSRLFLVRLDSQSQDPVAVVHGQAGSPTTFVPLYSPYPDGTTAAYASGAIVRERKTALSWLVEIPYRWVSPAVYQGWAVSFRFGVETEHIKTTVTTPHKVIGPNVYRYVPEGGEAFADFVTIGPPDATHLDGKWIALERSGIRRPVGFDRTKPVCNMVLSRDVPYLNVEVVGPPLASATSRVNSDLFFGAAPGQIKFVGANIDRVVGASANSPAAPDGTFWRVALEFLWHGDKHSPYEAIHTVTDEAGNEGIVYNVSSGGGPGTPVTETFDVYEKANMSALLQLFQ